MTACGATQQLMPLAFLAFDYLSRPALNFSIRVTERSVKRIVQGHPVPGVPFVYRINITVQYVGDHLVEMLIDGKQQPNSPFIMPVSPRVCWANSVPNEFGQCVCSVAYISGGGETCISLAWLLPTVILPGIALMAVLVYVYMQIQVSRLDGIWRISPDELHFSNPPEVLGQGTFGRVYKAEFRGEKYVCVRGCVFVRWVCTCAHMNVCRHRYGMCRQTCDPDWDGTEHYYVCVHT
jgi:hypothetical protein